MVKIARHTDKDVDIPLSERQAIKNPLSRNKDQYVARQHDPAHIPALKPRTPVSQKDDPQYAGRLAFSRSLNKERYLGTKR